MPPQRPALLGTYLGRITRNLAYNRWKAAAADKRGGGQTAAVLEELAECLPGPESAEEALDKQELERAIRDGKRVAVPKCYGDEMRFIWMEDLSRVEKGYAGIPEPIEDGPVADDKTALVLMPGLAFDPQGRRIGYGGGFYDRFLADEPEHPTLALCYDFQMLPELETEEFDIPVDCVLWA